MTTLKFDILGLDLQFFNAVDGTLLNVQNLTELDLKVMPGYRNPYVDNGMFVGEVGCLLSHYNVWKDIVAKGHQAVLVLEDDLGIQPDFKIRLGETMEHI